MTTCVAGLPHSEICGYNAFYQLTTAYRRLTRPSSPLTAKAFTVYAYSLNHTTHISLIAQQFTSRYKLLKNSLFQLFKFLKNSMKDKVNNLVIQAICVNTHIK